MYGPSVGALQTGNNAGDKIEEYSKKTHKKRKRVRRPALFRDLRYITVFPCFQMTEDGKGSDSAKRMRSSISQSNIEYHYQRALEYR